jgi:hypothetical protein
MDPQIAIRLWPAGGRFQPDQELSCEYRIEASYATQVQGIEASVLWYTEGKGEEDLVVHYFERHVPGDVERGDLRGTRRFATRLPPSPLSYDGVIVKVCWCVRVRVFLRRGRDVAAECLFRLGHVPPGRRLEPPLAEQQDPDEVALGDGTTARRREQAGSEPEAAIHRIVDSPQAPRPAHRADGATDGKSRKP